MKILITTLCVISLIIASLATEQVDEYLSFEDRQERMHATPLESYLEAKNKKSLFPQARSSSACWRGYIGSWIIDNNRLYLISLNKYDYKKENELGEFISLSYVFESKTAPVEADWFTGVIALPRGNRLNDPRFIKHCHIFEKKLYLTIRKGKLIKRTEVDNTTWGATRSAQDIERIVMAEESLVDDVNWIDARSLNTAHINKTIITRGFLLKDEDDFKKYYYLYIPRTPTTESLKLAIELSDENNMDFHEHIEIEGIFKEETQINGLIKKIIIAKKIRPLKLNESIHHPNYNSQVAD